MAFMVNVDGREFKVDVKKVDQGFLVLLDGKEKNVLVAHEEGDRLTLIVDDKPHSIFVESDTQVLVDGESYAVDVADEQVQRLLKASPDIVRKKELAVKAVMPGLVVDLITKEGNMVKAGEALMVIEAMKMQNDVKAARDGQVKKIHVKPGQTVNTGDVLVTIE
ncbi:MAG: biotin/lipoyl-binding protein [candidate division WOR-3 bacterium]|nr:MAG: biotin/lipoyl-binding protein [candidate division WOR-3 bacterium]